MPEAARVVHPGPVAAERCLAVPCRALRRRVTLRAGVSLLQAMTEAVAGAAWFDLGDLVADILSFVRPAPAPGDGHVAWYSATTGLEQARILRAGGHLGRRDGAPFAHVHGVWASRDGTLHAGHLLSEATVLARDAEVEVITLDGAMMESAENPETGFVLFRPVATAPVSAANAVLATVAPHEVIEEAIAAIASKAGLNRARIHGIGSLIGTHFETTGGISDYATEVLLTEATQSDGRARLSAISVGFDGPHAEGTLVPGINRVCVTFELLLMDEDRVPGVA